MRWGNKRYYSLDFYLKEQFGEKVYKIALDGGMTCPTRDGTKGTNGCIFCSAKGSGDFATPKNINITLQINQAIRETQRRHPETTKFIAYFQSFTNTYAPIEYLKDLYNEALEHPQIVALSIGTRPDCINKDVVSLLKECNLKKPVWIELGLQTIHESTAHFIRRGYSLNIFESALDTLNKAKLDVICHIILGLPGESKDSMLETIDYLSHSTIHGIKLQLLHVLKGTDLATHLGSFNILSLDEYVEILLACIGRLSPNIVIHRLTGDGPRNLLLEPTWSLHKRHVLNTIQQSLKKEDVWQGKYFID